MELVITLGQLAWAIVIIVLVGVGIYAAMALKNLNKLMQQVNEMVEKNHENLNRLIPNITQISDDAVLITEDLRQTVGETREALELITLTTKEKVNKFNETADNVGTYAIIAGEAAKILIEVLSDRKKKRK